GIVQPDHEQQPNSTPGEERWPQPRQRGMAAGEMAHRSDALPTARFAVSGQQAPVGPVSTWWAPSTEATPMARRWGEHGGTLPGGTSASWRPQWWTGGAGTDPGYPRLPLPAPVPTQSRSQGPGPR